MEDAPRRADEKIIIDAAVEAQETATRILEKLLGRHASRFSLIVSVEYDSEGPRNLVFEIEAYRARVERKRLEEVIDAAIQAALEAFEKKTGVRVGKEIRRRS